MGASQQKNRMLRFRQREEGERVQREITDLLLSLTGRRGLEVVEEEFSVVLRSVGMK